MSAPAAGSCRSWERSSSCSRIHGSIGRVHAKTYVTRVRRDVPGLGAPAPFTQPPSREIVLMRSPTVERSITVKLHRVWSLLATLLLAAALNGCNAEEPQGTEEPGSTRAPASYARPELLIEPEELAKPEVAGRFVIFDVRPRSEYSEGHLPGAYQVDHDAWKKAFGEGEDVEGWSRRIGGRGIDAASRVVIYDDKGMKDAARIWWILRYFGVKDVRLLNGGIRGWRAAELPITKTVPLSPSRVDFKATPRAERLATMAPLIDLLEGKPSANRRCPVGSRILRAGRPRQQAKRLHPGREASRMERPDRSANAPIQEPRGTARTLRQGGSRPCRPHSHPLQRRRPRLGDGLRPGTDGRRRRPQLLSWLGRMGQRREHADCGAGGEAVGRTVIGLRPYSIPRATSDPHFRSYP